LAIAAIPAISPSAAPQLEDRQLSAELAITSHSGRSGRTSTDTKPTWSG